MTTPTPAQMSEYLAEHLLGWERMKPNIGIAPFWSGGKHQKIAWGKDGQYIRSPFGYPLMVSNWHPHEDISQCFEYLIPAMRDRGWHYEITDDVVTFFSDDEDDIGTFQSLFDGVEKTPLAITEACYLAMKAEKGE